MSKIKIFLSGIILGIVVTLVFVFILPSESMAGDMSSAYGSVFDSDTTQSLFTINSGNSGSIINDGTAVVYFDWAAGTVETNTNAKDGKCYLNSGDSIHVPAKVKRFTHKTSAGSAKLRYICD